MFVLTRLEENFRVPAEDLGRPRIAAITSVIDRLLVDRIFHQLGLYITLYDIVRVDTGVVHPNDGGVWFQTQFRMVIFRPFVGEVIIAKIKKQNSDGLQLSLGFFDDVFIPEHFLPDPSFYDEEEGVWFWSYTNEEGETNKMYMEMEDDVRLKVCNVKFSTAPSYEETKKARETDPQFATDEKPFALMQVFGEMSSTGLGPLLWWTPQVDEEPVSGDKKDANAAMDVEEKTST